MRYVLVTIVFFASAVAAGVGVAVIGRDNLMIAVLIAVAGFVGGGASVIKTALEMPEGVKRWLS